MPTNESETIFFSSSSFFHSAMVFKKRLCSDKVFFIRSLFRANARHRSSSGVGKLCYIILDLSDNYRRNVSNLFVFVILYGNAFFSSLMKWQNAKGLCL